MHLTFFVLSAFFVHTEGLTALPKPTPLFQTCLPGSRLDALVESACTAERLGHSVVPHVPATRFRSVEELDGFLQRLCARCQVDRVLVIGGERQGVGGGISVKAEAGTGGDATELSASDPEVEGAISNLPFPDSLALLQSNLL